MKKIFLVLIICILCFTACSSKNKNKEEQQKQAVDVTPTPTPNSIQSELDKMDEKAKEDAKDAQIIESGDLYDSIKSICEKPIVLIKLKNQYSLSINIDNPKLFFNKCEIIFKKVFKENESVAFCMDSDNKKNIAMLTVVKNGNPNSFPIHASLIAFDDDKKEDITSSYSKNKYWQSIDLDNLSQKELQKIKDEYSK